MTIIAIISKLPNDLKDVQHILPFWFTYLYYFAWTVGIALVAILLIYLFSKLYKYMQSLPAKKHVAAMVKERSYTRLQLNTDLKIIMDNAINNEEFRMGLHRMSGVMKSYFEIALKKEIEEMTAKEIRTHVKERKELGHFFTELTVVQYGISDPDKEEFLMYYKKAQKLVR